MNRKIQIISASFLLYSSFATAGLFDDIIKDAKNTLEEVVDQSGLSNQTPDKEKPPTKTDSDASSGNNVPTVKSKNEEAMAEPKRSDSKTAIDEADFRKRWSNYYNRPKLWFAVEEELPEVQPIIIKGGNALRTLHSAFHKGLPRVGALKNTNVTPNVKQRNHVINDAYDYIKHDTLVYLSLTMVGKYAQHFTSSQLLIDNSVGRFQVKESSNSKASSVKKVDGRHAIIYFPRNHFDLLAMYMLKTEQYLEAFCSYEKCTRGTSRGPHFDMAKSGAPWGGHNANAFDARDAFMDFLDNNLPHIIEHGESMPKEFYLVGSTNVKNAYNFQRKGFEISLLGESDIVTLLPGCQDDDGKISLSGQNFRLCDSGKKFPKSMFVPMSAEQAEKLIMNNDRWPFLFSVVKARILHMDMRPGNNRFSKKLIFEIISDNIDFYTDVTLQKKVHSATAGR